MQNKITKVRKRDGSIVLFNYERLVQAVFKSAQAAGGSDRKTAEEVADRVVDVLNEKFHANSIPAVEEIQDLIEKVLIEEGHAATAKAFILYRQERSKLREQKKEILDGLIDDSKLDLNQVRIVAAKYLARDDTGKIIETPAQMFKRVARALASKEIHATDAENNFHNIMHTLDFIPSGRILANANLRSRQLQSCYVLPIPDSIKGIFESVKHASLIHKAGAGTGFDFSSIRPKGSKVTMTNGNATGPVSFMKLIDFETETIKQGSGRGANMGVLRADHPDIVAFITSKKDLDELQNFNISVAITNEFMEALEKEENYPLTDPFTGRETGKASAKKVFDLIVRQAWETGEPGLLFIDRINDMHPLKGLGDIEATDPCGELPLLPYESAVMGSVNLANMVKNKTINWDRLKTTVRTGVELLDCALDLTEFPSKKFEEMSKRTRKIGLGLMGYADMLYQLRIPYNSEEGIKTAKKIMAFIQKEAHEKSQELGETKGPFKDYAKSIYVRKNIFMRNSTVTSIGPTGTISMISGTSSGCEPNFGLGYIKNVLGGQKFVYVNEYFREAAKEEGIYSEELMKKVAERGSLASIEGIPEELKKVFAVAHEISPEYHVKTQAALQEHVDSAISKTINFSNHATLEDIKEAFLLAWKLGCKGVTIYRDGSRGNQVFNISEVNEKVKEVEAALVAE